MLYALRLIALAFLLLPGSALATSEPRGVQDPTETSQPVFGRIDVPGETDLFTFTPSRDTTLSIEVVTPVRPSSRDFRPVVTVYRAGLSDSPVPAGIPPGYIAEVISADVSPSSVYEPISAERLLRIGSRQIAFTGGQPVYFSVSEPTGRIGDYIVGLGSATDFSNISISSLFSRTIEFKLGLSEGRSVPIGDFIGMFLAVFGLIVGLGSVMLIDILGLLGRTSAAWTSTAIRVHRITKPLIWTGLGVYYIGLSVLYRESGFSGPGTLQEVLLLLLVVNGVYLSFVISPRLVKHGLNSSQRVLSTPLQWRIIIAAIISQLLWWSQVALLCWYVIVVR